ncbi:MAG: hypothetical protein K0Q72_1627 [Armatimonadetes bacterium]|jgi:hypothetical protein|nr:hypothetical protein [Armatimonadota bacterium]
MAVAQEKPSTNAIIALVLGILSVMGGNILTGIPAWILGKKELSTIDAGQAPAAGRTMASIGMWLGIVATVLTIVGAIFFVVVAGGMAAFMGSGVR